MADGREPRAILCHRAGSAGSRFSGRTSPYSRALQAYSDSSFGLRLGADAVSIHDPPIEARSVRFPRDEALVPRSRLHGEEAGCIHHCETCGEARSERAGDTIVPSSDSPSHHPENLNDGPGGDAEGEC